MPIVIEIEIGTQSGFVTWARYVDPAKDQSVRLEGDNVIECPKLKEFQPVTT